MDTNVHDDLQPVTDPASVASRSGRPRDDSRDLAILEAALELIAESGYERVSMDAIAGRARASKATIYRRWDSKGALVAAAVRCRAMQSHATPNTGSLRDDLLAVVRLMADSMSAQDIGLLSALFAAMRADSELAAAMRCDMLAEKTQLTEPIFDRAAYRGDVVHPRANALFHEIAPSVVLNRVLVNEQPTDDDFCVHLVDDILIPVLSRCP